MAGRLIVLLYICIGWHTVLSWRQFNTWSDESWCSQVEAPAWPYAYSKYGASATSEAKGRTASNMQNMGHTCALRGARSKCHRCEAIACSAGLTSTCDYQIQGVDWANLPVNTPTVTDAPFAVGAATKHRYDFGSAQRVCVFLSGGPCTGVDPLVGDYSRCALRCWGSGATVPPKPYSHGWAYNASSGQPQGRSATVAGVAGLSGLLDGSTSSARFANPQGVAVDRQGNVYVADTGNHAVRMVTPAGMVYTIAGSGRVGFLDGLGTVSLFSSPAGIATYERCMNSTGTDIGPVRHDGNGPAGETCATYQPFLVIADTHNHRIRIISNASGWTSGYAVVTTLAGGGGGQADDLEKQAHGLADGEGHLARFDTPMAVAADNDGNVFVADTSNHVIRWVTPTGTVRTLAGTVAPQRKPLPGCGHPCLQGITGHVDGTLAAARFSNPLAIALGPGTSPYSLIVADGHRIRLITASAGDGDDWTAVTGVTPQFTGNGSSMYATSAEISSLARVYTLAGSLTDGESDGDEGRARFDSPKGVAVSGNGRVYVADSARCRIRRLTVGGLVSRPLTCAARLVDILRPSGCTSYDDATDAIGRLGTPWAGHIVYRGNASQELVAAAGTHAGRLLRRCIGAPPPDIGIFANGSTVSATGGTLSGVFSHDEDEGSDTQMMLYCPPGCASAVGVKVYGGDGGRGRYFYADESHVCAAAVHAGTVDDSAGGYVVLTLHKGFGAQSSAWRATWDGGSTSSDLPGSTSNGVTSLSATGLALGGPVTRTFSTQLYPHPLNSTLTQTIAGMPGSPLGGSCGYADAQPPMASQFSGPSGIALFKGMLSPDDTLRSRTSLIIADAHNHVIRALSAVCAQACENGGVCGSDEKCICTTGWTGPDCTSTSCSTPCPARSICSGPEECTCIPGYTGTGCLQAQCVQTCRNGGSCVAPDTCGCTPGWFDANCTTPVCSQTCGNGSNCTAPDTCTCPSMWSGADCRTPVCAQACTNGGVCSAPDTCTCPPSWSGHDCSKPVCHQGYFRADPYPHGSSNSTWREPSWQHWIPCAYNEWCAATAEFQCLQAQKGPMPLQLPLQRNMTGKGPNAEADSLRGAPYGSGLECIPFELNVGLRSPFRAEIENGTLTYYARNTSLAPYGWGPAPGYNTWSAEFPASSDRQVLHGTWATVPQGVYVCANGGNCTAPDTCTCAPGWLGFDCRIPVCTQGYYYPARVDSRFPGSQGTYWGSPRTLTVWESPDTPNGKFSAYIHDHPNFHSINEDMDVQLGFDQTHIFRPGPGSLFPPEFTTLEGWRLPGVWSAFSSQVEWRQGDFKSTYNRTCPGDTRKQADLRAGFPQNKAVNDTMSAFSPRISVSDASIVSSGRWIESGGECTDEVIIGCFNGGVCAAPNTCKCSPGWEGSDCSLPICTFTSGEVSAFGTAGTGIAPTLLRFNGSNFGTPDGEPPLPGDKYIGWRKCAHEGNCTRPNTCTCEKGWEGADCLTPMCAQECMNLGRCVGPDTCDCQQQPTPFVDRRGVPLFQKPNGEPQSTGWTGYDCNTPVCTQATQWIPNDGTGSQTVVLLASTDKPIRNDGSVFQTGCPGGGDYIPVDARTRISLKLCFNDVWWQGSFADSSSNDDEGSLTPSLRSAGRTVRINHANYLPPPEAEGKWLQGPTVPGEGMYACANGGACTAPDVCTCNVGWSGFDCAVPGCTYVNVYREVIVGCSHGGVCFAVNECDCPKYPSLLPAKYPLDGLLTDAMTGWTASDCSMAICTQGTFDPDCRDVAPGPGGVSHMAEGCYRCANGGNCTAPDTCTCDAQWTGYDCKTPICVQHAMQETIYDLDTLNDEVIQAFEQDPCGHGSFVEINGKLVGKGNCTRPNTCTCLCILRAFMGPDGRLDEKPWVDELSRPLLPGYIFGKYECLDGFQGNLNEDGTFSSCHLRIKVPTPIERYSLLILCVGVVVSALSVPSFYMVRRLARQQQLRVKAERRRARREEEAQEKIEKEEAAAAGKRVKKAKKA